MKKKIVTLGLVQTKMTANHEKNLARATAMVEQAAKKGAEIICLPELFRTLYFPQQRSADKNKYAEAIPGISTNIFAAIAKKYGVVIVVPVYEKKGTKFHNSAAVIDERGRLMPTYRKVHIPHDPLFYEKNYFEQGNEYRIYKTKRATFAVLICYDQWFPEAARAATLKGAEIIFYPTAIGRIVPRKERDDDWANAWETVMRGHAIANSVHVAAVNRTGAEGKLRFWGSSFVADSFGNILKRASDKREEVVIVRADLTRNKTIREGWRFFHNRRPDTYGPIGKKRA